MTGSITDGPGKPGGQNSVLKAWSLGVGWCGECGFWDPHQSGSILVAAGSFSAWPGSLGISTVMATTQLAGKSLIGCRSERFQTSFVCLHGLFFCDVEGESPAGLVCFPLCLSRCQSTPMSVPRSFTALLPHRAVCCLQISHQPVAKRLSAVVARAVAMASVTQAAM